MAELTNQFLGGDDEGKVQKATDALGGDAFTDRCAQPRAETCPAEFKPTARSEHSPVTYKPGQEDGLGR